MSLLIILGLALAFVIIKNKSTEKYVFMSGNIMHGSELYKPMNYISYSNKLNEIGKTNKGLQVFSTGDKGIICVIDLGVEMLYENSNQNPINFRLDKVSEIIGSSGKISDNEKIGNIVAQITDKNQAFEPEYVNQQAQVSFKVKGTNIFLVFQLVEDVDKKYYLYDQDSDTTYKINESQGEELFELCKNSDGDMIQMEGMQ